jgi:hypothetical protein
MRTTVTLDSDVELLLRDAMRERGISFKQALNQAARDGLVRARQPRAKRFVQKTHSFGAGSELNLDKALALADALEDEERIRKMQLGR